MKFIEVGCRVNGEDAKSKKAIKDALKLDGSFVEFYSVGGMNEAGVWYGDELKQISPDVILTVVGPNPFTNRKFYGSVDNGKFS